jgi:hypothetical protein
VGKHESKKKKRRKKGKKEKGVNHQPRIHHPELTIVAIGG